VRRSVEIDGKAVVALGCRSAQETADPCDTGVVDQYIGDAEFGSDTVEGLGECSGIAHIERYGQCGRTLGAQSAHQSLEPVGAASDHGDSRTGSRERAGEFGTYAARGSGDDGDTTVQSECAGGVVRHVLSFHTRKTMIA
jgi:hypothetical protein